MDDVIARLWAAIDDLESYRALVQRDFDRSRQNFDKAMLAIDEKIKTNLKEIEEILRKES